MAKFHRNSLHNYRNIDNFETILHLFIAPTIYLNVGVKYVPKMCF